MIFIPGFPSKRTEAWLQRHPWGGVVIAVFMGVMTIGMVAADPLGSTEDGVWVWLLGLATFPLWVALGWHFFEAMKDKRAAKLAPAVAPDAAEIAPAQQSKPDKRARQRSLSNPRQTRSQRQQARASRPGPRRVTGGRGRTVGRAEPSSTAIREPPSR